MGQFTAGLTHNDIFMSPILVAAVLPFPDAPLLNWRVVRARASAAITR